MYSRRETISTCSEKARIVLPYAYRFLRATNNTMYWRAAASVGDSFSKIGRQSQVQERIIGVPCILQERHETKTERALMKSC